MRHSENNEYNIYQDCYRDSNDHSISDLNQMIKQLRINANGNENNAVSQHYIHFKIAIAKTFPLVANQLRIHGFTERFSLLGKQCNNEIFERSTCETSIAYKSAYHRQRMDQVQVQTKFAKIP